MQYELILFHYWRSSCSWRVRLALEYKQIPCQFVPVNLLDDSVESEEHLARNPLGTVPALLVKDNIKGRSFFLIESLAIIQWLEDAFPHSPSLYPKDKTEKAMVLALAELINADTQPLQNLTPLELHSNDAAEKKKWAQFFIRKGLLAFEKYALNCNQVLGMNSTEPFCIGKSLSLADVCLIPQCYNAIRFDTLLNETPFIQKCYEALLKMEFCKKSHPDSHQPKI